MAERKNPEPLVYTPAEFARLFGRSQTWAYRQLYAGKVQAITRFGRIMIPSTEAGKILSEAGTYNGAKFPVQGGRSDSAAKPPATRNVKDGGTAWKKAVGLRRATPGKLRFKARPARHRIRPKA